MGTKSETVELQEKIKQLISDLGWSQNKLARIVYTEVYEFDDEAEIYNFQERLKKELQRKTTGPDRLKVYLSIIIKHPEAVNIDLVLNKYIPMGAISEPLSDEMCSISKEIDKASNNETKGGR